MTRNQKNPRFFTRFTYKVAMVACFFGANIAICQENAIDTTNVNYDSSWVQSVLNDEGGSVAKNLFACIQKESIITTPIKKVYRPRELWEDAKLRDIIFNFAAFGKSAATELRDTVSFASSPTKDIVTVILGLQGDSTVKQDLRSIIKSGESHTVREIAVHALSGCKDPADIPLFKQALSDTFWVTTYKDYILEDGRDHETFYPVRDKAAEALRSFGFTVTHDFSGNYTILEDPK